MPAYEFEGLIPVIHPEAYVHPSAVLVGDCVIERGCFIAPGAVLRGDLARITVMEGSNIQDQCVIHSFPGGEVVLEAHAHVGHGAIVHGCHIGRNALIGIHAVIMDHAQIGEEAFIAAMAFVKNATIIPARTLAMGIPATVVRPLRDDEIAWKKEATRHYQNLARRYLGTARETTPLCEIEPNRPTLPSDGPTSRPTGATNAPR